MSLCARDRRIPHGLETENGTGHHTRVHVESLPFLAAVQEAFGTPIDNDARLQRGDLIFFPGHVGIMTDGKTLLHANAFWMAVVKEPLADVVARLATDHPSPIIARLRIGA